MCLKYFNPRYSTYLHRIKFNDTYEKDLKKVPNGFKYMQLYAKSPSTKVSNFKLKDEQENTDCIVNF